MLVRLPGEAGLARHIALISQHMKAILPSLDYKDKERSVALVVIMLKEGKEKCIPESLHTSHTAFRVLRTSGMHLTLVSLYH